ncbi:MAG: hypothetical protein WCH00_00645 [Candidatus Saccharibacteria bacterium]
MAQTSTKKPIRFADSRLFYRIFEIIPGLTAWLFILGPVVFSLFAPLAVAYFIIAFDIYWLLKSIRTSFALVLGYKKTRETERIDWNDRLYEINDLPKALADAEKQLNSAKQRSAHGEHIRNLRKNVERLELLSKHRNILTSTSDVYHCMIMPVYNESIDIVRPSVQAILDSEFDTNKIIMVLTYEERGGELAHETAAALEKEFGNKFGFYKTYCHPDGVTGEIKGKGPNITYAGRKILEFIRENKIKESNVVVTTLDCDNRVHEQYLSRLTYAYCTNPNRKHCSFQPLTLFFNNLWDVPAPMRVLATGNSFWVMVESVRQYRLRNFASHAQPLDALVETDFWSLTSPVEDGHQFYRSYFAFDGDYMVEPLFIPIYQDAVLTSKYHRTYIAQFKQLQRWAYGASDFPYLVKNSVKNNNIPWSNKLLQIGRLFEGHLSWATAPLILTFAAWAPLYLNSSFNKHAVAHQLPIVASDILTLATIGLFSTIWISFIMMPKRPPHQKWYKIFFMLAQWVLVPITAIVFGAFAAISAQTRLMFGRYLGFYVTEKAVKK